MFERMFKDDLYLELAHHSNECAKVIREGLKKLNIEILYPNNTNQIFILLDNTLISKLEKEYSFEIWERKNDKSIIRIVTNFSTKVEKCNELLNFIRNNK